MPLVKHTFHRRRTCDTKGDSLRLTLAALLGVSLCVASFAVERLGNSSISPYQTRREAELSSQGLGRSVNINHPHALVDLMPVLRCRPWTQSMLLSTAGALLSFLTPIYAANFSSCAQYAYYEAKSLSCTCTRTFSNPLEPAGDGIKY